MTISSAGSRELRLAAMADELRADAANGRHYSADNDDRERYQRLRELSATLMSHVDDRSAAELRQIFDRDVGLRTPLIGVVLMLNHQRDGLLFIDKGDSLGVEYAYVDPKSDHDAAIRELASRLLPNDEVMPVPHGICDSISAGLATPHTYFLTYVVDVTLTETSAIAAELVPEAQAPAERLDALTTFLLGGARRDVLESPFGLTDEVAGVVEEVNALALQGLAAETSDAYDIDRFGRIIHNTESLLEGVRDQRDFTPVRFSHMETPTPHTCAEMLILDDEQRILLLRRPDNGKWAMPGGACEVGETSGATAVRETLEEVHLDTTIAGLAGVFHNDLDGYRPEQLLTCFVYVGHPAVLGAEPSTSAEATEVEWFRLSELDDLTDLWEHQRVKITGALKTIVE